MKKFIILFVLVVWLVPMKGYSSDWQKIYTTLGSEYYIDLESVEKKPFGYELFIKQIYTKDKAKELKKTLKLDVLPGSAVHGWVVYCSTKSMSLNSMTIYATNHSSVAYSNSTPSMPTKVLPDTVGEGIWKYMCEIYKK